MLTSSEVDYALQVIDRIYTYSRLLASASKVGDEAVIADTASSYDLEICEFEHWVKESQERFAVYADYVRLAWDQLQFHTQDVTYVVMPPSFLSEDTELWKHICTPECARRDRWMWN